MADTPTLDNENPRDKSEIFRDSVPSNNPVPRLPNTSLPEPIDEEPAFDNGDLDDRPDGINGPVGHYF